LKEIEVELNRNNFWLTQVYSEFYMENDVSIKKIKEKVIEWYKKKIEDLNNNKNEILIKLDKYNRIESSKKWIKEVIDKFKKNIKWIGEDSKKLELIKKFVDKIIVNEDGSVKIIFRFEDLW
jgi:predicted transcriptional regulator